MKVPTARVVVGPLDGGCGYGQVYLHILPAPGFYKTHCGRIWEYPGREPSRSWRQPRSGDERLPLCSHCRKTELGIQHHDREVARAMAKVGFS